jgi:hypothetical protein
VRSRKLWNIGEMEIFTPYVFSLPEEKHEISKKNPPFRLNLMLSKSTTIFTALWQVVESALNSLVWKRDRHRYYWKVLPKRQPEKRWFVITWERHFASWRMHTCRVFVTRGSFQCFWKQVSGLTVMWCFSIHTFRSPWKEFSYDSRYSHCRLRVIS